MICFSLHLNVLSFLQVAPQRKEEPPTGTKEADKESMDYEKIMEVEAIPLDEDEIKDHGAVPNVAKELLDNVGEMGLNDVVVAGGMESMCNLPQYLAEASCKSMYRSLQNKGVFHGVLLRTRCFRVHCCHEKRFSEDHLSFQIDFNELESKSRVVTITKR